MSSYIALKLNNSDASLTSNGKEYQSINKASELAAMIVKLYNDQDNKGLYESFDALAKADFSQKQFSEQTQKLHNLFGDIEYFAYSGSEYVGKNYSRDFYKIYFKVRTNGGSFNTGRLELTVAEKDNDDLGLFGLFLKGRTSTE